MKKRFYVFSMLAAGMLLAGCSDDLEGGQDGPNVVEGATGYAKVTISLPSTTGTRAANDSFDDGLDSEWTVKSGIIAYFSGVSEENAVFVGAYNLPGTWNQDETHTDAITATQTLTAQAPLLKNNTNPVYALVILNGHSNVISMNNNTHSLTIAGTTYDAEGTTALKLADLRTKLEDQDIADYTGNDGFTMLNAPLATKAVISSDNSAKVEILQPITIYETEAEANQNSATVIHLERVMAKVTLTGFDAEENGELRKDITGLPQGYSGYAVLEGWTLDVTNKSTKLLHDVTPYSTWFGHYNPNINSGGGNSRFVADTEPYRIYWSVDGNYDGSNYGTANPNTPTDTRYSQEFNYIADVTSASDIEWEKKIGSDNPLYCFENTFDAANMKEAQTTRIVLTGQYFFTQETGAEGASTNSNVDAEDPSFFVMGKDEPGHTYTIANFIKQVNDKIGGSPSFLADGWKPAAGVNGGTYDTVEGLATLLGMDAQDDAANLQTILSEFGSVKYYKDAQVFYHVSRIEHFGDDYTPWTEATDGDPYNYTEEKHLGRYGVVRNNWYELHITKITSPGEPEIPDTPDTPDDEETGYVKAEIRILAWAKRTQDVEL
ncbi:MAG TPA: Mfa1 family fimbria major subunit [Candidatus Parabacteroides intestinigallinarum]|uniref:Mfa1 family fimbria major subunit n=1 Tax=Candidatus Parabacteroides intestinigallinarum TaxID=2838722 RepID=A0A9D2BR69_9BACT|nr:Mfa1 family fimbria major subunit [Candidatus Parabacteroides intestinigallinarum]